VRHDAIGPDLSLFIDTTQSWIGLEHDACKKACANGPLEGQVRVSMMSMPRSSDRQDSIRRERIDPADVVRLQRLTRDYYRGQALGLGVGRCSRAGASGERCAGCRQRPGPTASDRDDRGE